MQSAVGPHIALAGVEPAAVTRAAPYRPDIDGLRAVSVLAVILFHAEVPWFPGGYVGVDVFFVISGYLITQVLMAPSERGLRAQLRDFYVRRCRRILPALIAMLLASALVAYWLFLPRELMRFGKFLAYTSGLLSNLAAWRDGGYFDLHSSVNPLLHLWSIAVEEQFYLVFPLFFLASGRALGTGRLALLSCAALASLVLCVWASYYKPNANFFLAPTRAWELLLGSLVALGVGRSLSVHPARDAFAGAALLALLACVAFYDDTLRYPGLYAAVPCVSAAILLATARSSPSRVSRWLSARPLVFTGLISYSLYLWHLPVLAFAAYYTIRPLELRHLAVLLPLIYVLSAVTWRYVETPVRGRRLLGSDARFLPAMGVATVVIALLGLILWRSEGLPGRSDEAEQRLLTMSDRLLQDARACERPLSAIAAGSLCRFGPSSGATADVVVWGDSHAMALLPAYERIAIERGMNLYAAVLSSCRPLLDSASRAEKPARRAACGEFNRTVVSAIEAIDPDLVILNAYWAYPDLDIVATAAATAAAAAQDPSPFEAALERALRAIDSGHRKTCVVGDVPTLSYSMPYAYAVARKRGIDPAFIALRSEDAELQLQDVNRHFAALLQRHDFTFVNPTDVLCSGPTCAVLTADGRSVYRDNHHLSVAGAHLVGGSLEPCFDAIR